MKYKYTVDTTSDFKKDYKKIIKQGKKIEKIKTVIDKLACGEKIDSKYKDHKLNNNKKYKDCRELHIEPDWLLVYRIIENELILLLLDTGSHSDLF
jgi:mRNA interferase YafQ